MIIAACLHALTEMASLALFPALGAFVFQKSMSCLNSIRVCCKYICVNLNVFCFERVFLFYSR